MAATNTNPPPLDAPPVVPPPAPRVKPGVAPDPTPVRGEGTLTVQMVVPYASGKTVLVAGKAYTVNKSFGEMLLDTDPPSATLDIDESNKRIMRPPTPDPEDKSNQ